MECFFEIIKSSLKQRSFFIRPRFIRSLPHTFLNLFKTSRFRKLQIIDFTILSKINHFIICFHFFATIFYRHYSNHFRKNRYCIKKFQYTYSFITFLDIITIQIFICFNTFTNSFFYVRLA